MLLGCTLFVGCVTAKFSTELDRVALHYLQLVFDLVMASHFVSGWNLPLLKVDRVLNDGVGDEVKVDGVVVINLKETGSNLLDEIRILRADSYQNYKLSCMSLYPPLVRVARPAPQSLKGLHR